jgi:hypothetical protein
MGNPAGGAVVSGRSFATVALFLLGSVATAAGTLVLAWMLWISVWAGFANLDLIGAIRKGNAALSLVHYGAIAIGILLIWFGKRAALGRASS